MKDAELMRLAAKAAGLEVTEERGGGLPWTVKRDGRSYAWHPLEEDGDAMLLLVRLKFGIEYTGGVILVYSENGDFLASESYEDDEFHGSTLRAITTAAAKIGEAMP